MSDKKIKMVCPFCASDNVSKGATVRWDVPNQLWAITGIFDDGHCDNCDTELKSMLEIEVDSEPNPAALKFAESMQIVLDLARQNVVDERDMPEEHTRQTEACNQLEDFITNQLAHE